MNKETKEQLKYLLLSYGNRDADEEFIKTATSLIIKGMNLSNYVLNIVYIARDNHMNPIFDKYTNGIAGLFAQAAYVKKDKVIVIYERNLFYFKDMFIKNKNISEEKSVFKNLLIIQTLLHELEHANQDRLVQEGSTIEAELLKVLADVEKPPTTASYEVSPIERGAEIKSIDQVIELARAIDISSQKIFAVLQEIRNDQMERGYNFKFEDDYLEASPIKQYADLRGIDLGHLDKVISGLDDSLYDIYGCPLELHDLEAKTGREERIHL